ncbi:nucleic acid binding [Tyrophagus putrescentiae]|nr:nucleic acid binding [Tyrophagus putrescentiae]
MFEQGDGPNHRVALISDLVDYPEGAKEFVSEIVKFSQLCDAEACHQVLDLIDGIMRHAKDRYRTDSYFTPEFAKVLYILMNNLFPKCRSNIDYLDLFVEFLTNWKKDRIFEQTNFDMDYLLSQLEKFYPIGSMPNSTYNNTSLYNQLVESSYGSSYPPMANSGQNGLPWTGYEYLQNNSLNPNNQYPPPPPDQYPLQHAPSLGVQPFYFPQPSAQPLFQKAPWLRNVILVDGKTASPPLPTPRAGHVTLCSSTIRVSGLPDKCTEQDLTVKFKNHGIVYSVTIMRENGNRIALVCMKRRQHAKKAYDSFSKTLLLRKFFGPLITLEWKAGPGLTALRNYQDYWDGNSGVAYVPHYFFNSEAALENIGESFTVDSNSLPST